MKPKWPGLAMYNLPLYTVYACNNFCNLNLFYFFSYRILGLCNNFAYVIMLSAAHDILKDQEQKDHVESHNVIIYNNRKSLTENFNDQWMTFEMVKWWHLVVDLLKIGQEKKLTKENFKIVFINLKIIKSILYNEFW